MKKSDFITLLFGVMGGLLFSVGMCMCLLPEWDAFIPGVAVTAVGAATLIILIIVRRIKSGKPARQVNWKLVGKIVFAVFGALVLGLGMCMIMVWDMMLAGILVGIAGIAALLCLIPMFVGLK